MEPNVARINPWTALLRILTDPMNTFRRLGEKPAILPAYVLQMAASLFLAAMTVPLALQLVMDQAASMPADQMPAGFEGMMNKVMVGTTLGQAVVTPWLAGLVVALLAVFVAQLTGGSVGFRAYFGMVGYARVPVALNAIIQGLLLTKAGTYSEAMRMSLSLATFLPADSNVYLQSLLGMVNPFSIWYYVLLALGFAALHKTKPREGWTFAGAILILNIIGSVASAAMGSAAAGL